MSMIWPVALVVLSNVFYQIAAKSVPKSLNPLASLTVTYLVGAAVSAVLFFALNRNCNLFTEYSKMNWAPFVLGLSVVGLEVGFIYAYKNGWAVSSASIVQSAFLSIALLFIGAWLYRETITASKLVGVVLCLVGLFFLNR